MIHSRTDRTIVTNSKAPQPLCAYSLGITVTPGRLLYVAGQVGVDSSGNLVGKGDAKAQTRQALENIGLVLAGAGGDFSNVVDSPPTWSAVNLSKAISRAGARSTRTSTPAAIFLPTPYWSLPAW